ncbi:hypothetical protein GALMADRAFT_237823 [Galerina marginata CBS 339.88]|uniref:Rad60/SUMO-like domain-containing protein n=1 Tax=Galerina marginata (strain CBS 339.88) TaxID=685588 RepID=A0A067TRI4_GALM3|nr:hypothetical protein GALMADRAFT_237823 [Galerina marginata CBS 339.88]
MAESTNRPRPRPRPRPIARTPSNAEPSATPGASSSSSTSIPVLSSNPGKRRVIEVQDTDEMFMRNKNRSYQTWQKLEQINKETTKQDKDASGDSDNAASPSKNRKHKKNKQEANHVPSWQKTKELTRMLSVDLSDDSDIEFTGLSTPNSKLNGKRKRQRSRSRSITPPPALPLHQIQNAKNVVRQTLKAAVRAPSPTFDPDESTDTIIFQPELNAIAKGIKAQSHARSSLPPEATAEDHVILNVTWHPHPLKTGAQKQKWQYKIDRTDAFRDLFEATAEDAEIPSANLIMAYQGKRFFPSVTPQTLKIWAETAELDAYEKTAYEYIHRNPIPTRHTASRAAGLSNSNAGGVIDVDSDGDNGDSDLDRGAASPPAYTQTQESDAESESEGEKFKLILRSGLTPKDITLTVRPTTKCGAIVKAFLKKAGLADKYPEVFADATSAPKKGGRKSKGGADSAKDPRLCIDGDKMENNTEIGDQDLEDGDMVEVVGL